MRTTHLLALSLLFGAPASLTLSTRLAAQGPVATITPIAPATRWTAELTSGTAVSLNTPLTIWQAGQPDIHFIAKWNTRPFYHAKYYAFRVLRMHGNRGWAFDFTHHKLYLQNTNTDVTHFELSHGYNLGHISRVWDKHGWLLSFGPGIVVTHPENTVRGKTFYADGGGSIGGGYYLDGVSVMGSVGRHVKIAGPFFLSGLTKMTISDVRTRVVDGGAEVPNVAFHFNIGLGTRF